MLIFVSKQVSKSWPPPRLLPTFIYETHFVGYILRLGVGYTLNINYINPSLCVTLISVSLRSPPRQHARQEQDAKSQVTRGARKSQLCTNRTTIIGLTHTCARTLTSHDIYNAAIGPTNASACRHLLQASGCRPEQVTRRRLIPHPQSTASSEATSGVGTASRLPQSPALAGVAGVGGAGAGALPPPPPGGLASAAKGLAAFGLAAPNGRLKAPSAFAPSRWTLTRGLSALARTHTHTHTRTRACVHRDASVREGGQRVDRGRVGRGKAGRAAAAAGRRDRCWDLAEASSPTIYRMATMALGARGRVLLRAGWSRRREVWRCRWRCGAGGGGWVGGGQGTRTEEVDHA